MRVCVCVFFFVACCGSNAVMCVLVGFWFLVYGFSFLASGSRFLFPGYLSLVSAFWFHALCLILVWCSIFVFDVFFVFWFARLLFGLFVVGVLC